MNFDWEILVSYCATDDRKLGENTTGWISEWVHLLSKRLGLLFDAQPTIVLNPNGLKSEGPDQNDAVNIFLLSEAFFASPTCIDFLQKALSEGDSSLNDPNFFIFLDPSHLKSGFNFPLGCSFYQAHPASGPKAPLSPFGTTHLSYFLGLEDICFDLFSFDQSKRGISGNTQKKVFLALTEPELKPSRNRVKRELERFGYRVLPFENWQPAQDRVAEETQFMMDQCDLSVHLVGKEFDHKKHGLNLLTPEYQNNLAASKSAKDGFFRFIWLPPTLDISSQTEFTNLLKLRDDPTAIQGAELLQVQLEELKRVVLNHLNQEETILEVSRGAQTRVGTVTSVYLIHQSHDPKSLSELISLLEAEGIEVLKLAELSSSLQIRKQHQENLAQCHGTLILYEESNPLWLEMKINDINKATGLGRGSRIEFRGLYMPNGAKTPDWGEKQPDLKIIQKKSLLKDFLKTIKSSGGKPE